jgi:hypothetical protein
MKRRLAFFLLMAALAAPSPSSAQISDGDVKTVTYKGASGLYDGVYLPFYNFAIAGMPGTSYWDFLCVDNLNYITNGATYAAKFTALETGAPIPDIVQTREGSDQLRLNQNVNSLTIALNNYRIAAYLYLQVAAETGQQALADLQRAAWFATNPGYAAGNNSYYAAAQAAVAGGWKANDFFVVTAVADLGNDGLIRATGGKQEYLVYSPVPEPGTVILLATGLLGVAYVGRRRRKLELDIEA